jgi:MerR family transcriptional regulator/heat shock protein HspR
MSSKIFVRRSTRGEEQDMADVQSDRGIFSISVAAELTGVQPQMLRVYEQRGLLSPERTEGGTRRYSQDELELIGEISELLDTGLNFAGVVEVRRLQAEVDALKREVARLRRTRA